MKKGLVISSALIALLLCSCSKNKTTESNYSPALEQNPNVQTGTQDTLKAMQDTLDKDGEKQPEAIDSSKVSKDKITAEMAYEGVNNYCHSEYDWSIAESDGDNPSDPPIMYVRMGEETESEYQVIFRSYTGAFVYFYVDKTSGIARLVEHVPTLDVKNEAGSINILEYLDKKQAVSRQ